MVDVGHGAPLILIPGIQGRWEWMGQAVEALATRCRVITASLAGNSGNLRSFDPTQGFDAYLGWVDDLLERAGLERAAICGVSYGGYVSLHYAAERPSRVTSLTMVSVPSPTWRPTCLVEWYCKAPLLLSPIFALSSPVRLYPEIAAAFSNLLARVVFVFGHLHRLTRYSFAPTSMAQRVRLLDGVDFAGDCARVSVPTHVVTGEPKLDRVVPVESSCEYVRTIQGATYTRLEGTGHIGLVTKPELFADVVGRFVLANAGNTLEVFSP